MSHTIYGLLTLIVFHLQLNIPRLQSNQSLDLPELLYGYATLQLYKICSLFFVQPIIGPFLQTIFAHLF